MLSSRSHLDCLLRSAYKSWMLARNTRVKGAKSWGKPDLSCCCFLYANGSSCTFSCAPAEHFATNHGMDRAATRKTKQVILSDPIDHYITHVDIIDDSTHRDGSLYTKRNFGLLELCRITDRTETPLEPMMLSEPTDNCDDQKSCTVHYPSHLMQIFSLKLAQIPIDSNSVELYGYMAVRDYQDSLLNYIVNRSREDPIIVQQGSLIEMTGPKRGICMRSSVLLEFDMRIKKGEQPEDDLQLIDGVTDFSELITPCCPFSNRIIGDCGAVDINLALVQRAVEATIEVVVSKVHSCFSLCFSSFVFICGLYKEIQLFHGTIGESRGLRRFVIAVKMDTWMHLKFNISQKGCRNDLERYCSFKATNHGYASQQIMVHLTSISAKVTWSTLPL